MARQEYGTPHTADELRQFDHLKPEILEKKAVECDREARELARQASGAQAQRALGRGEREAGGGMSGRTAGRYGLV